MRTLIISKPGKMFWVKVKSQTIQEEQMCDIVWNFELVLCEFLHSIYFYGVFVYLQPQEYSFLHSVLKEKQITTRKIMSTLHKIKSPIKRNCKSNNNEKKIIMRKNTIAKRQAPYKIISRIKNKILNEFVWQARYRYKKPILNQSNECSDKSKEIVEKGNEITEKSKKIFEISKEITEYNNEITEKSKKIIEISKKIIEISKEIGDKSKDKATAKNKNTKRNWIKENKDDILRNYTMISEQNLQKFTEQFVEYASSKEKDENPSVCSPNWFMFPDYNEDGDIRFNINEYLNLLIDVSNKKFSTNFTEGKIKIPKCRKSREKEEKKS